MGRSFIGVSEYYLAAARTDLPFVENSDSAEKGCGAEDCEGVLAVDTTGGGSGAVNIGAGNDVGGPEESDVG